MTHMQWVAGFSTACGLRTIRRNATPPTTNDWRFVSCESCKRTARYKATRSLELSRDAKLWLDAKEAR